CRTLKVYVFEAAAEARNWKSASSSVGTLPPLQVTFSTVVLSPVPLVCVWRFQPGAGTNESIEKPLGGVSSTIVVVALSFSVGTARLNSCRFFANATDGLIAAWAS